MKSSIRSLFSFLFLTICLAGTAIGQNIPIDFEASGNGASWTWTVFENDANPPLEIIPNPYQGGINNSATVAKFTAKQAGAPFAGCESMHGSDIGTFTIDSTNMMINIMVWKSVISDVGIKLVRSDNWSLGEIKIANTLTNQWEQITFDFTSHIGLTYDQIVIFPDFNARSADNIIYFDNVFGPTAVPTAVPDQKQFGLTLYPNPTKGQFHLRANSPMEQIRVYNMLGELVKVEASPGKQAVLDLSEFPKGVYTARALIEGQMLSTKVVKN